MNFSALLGVRTPEKVGKSGPGHGFQYMACMHACVPILSSESRQVFPKSTIKSSKVGISKFVALRRCDHRFWRTLFARVYPFL